MSEQTKGAEPVGVSGEPWTVSVIEDKNHHDGFGCYRFTVSVALPGMNHALRAGRFQRAGAESVADDVRAALRALASRPAEPVPPEPRRPLAEVVAQIARRRDRFDAKSAEAAFEERYRYTSMRDELSLALNMLADVAEPVPPEPREPIADGWGFKLPGSWYCSSCGTLCGEGIESCEMFGHPPVRNPHRVPAAPPEPDGVAWEFVVEVAQGPYPDSNAASLLRTLTERARAILASPDANIGIPAAPIARDALREAAEQVCSWGENARTVLHQAVASGKSVDPEQALQLSHVWRDIDALRAALTTQSGAPTTEGDER